jgi:hypothetical protein
MDIGTYKAQLAEILSKETALKEEKIRLSQAMFSKKAIQEQADLLKQLYEKLKTKLEGATDIQKQQIARLFIEKIKVYPKTSEAEIMLNLRPNLPEKQGITRVNGHILRDVYAGRIPGIRPWSHRSPATAARGKDHHDIQGPRLR